MKNQVRAELETLVDFVESGSAKLGGESVQDYCSWTRVDQITSRKRLKHRVNTRARGSTYTDSDKRHNEPRLT